jgi:hypothetical protein
LLVRRRRRVGDYFDREPWPELDGVLWPEREAELPEGLPEPLPPGRAVPPLEPLKPECCGEPLAAELPEGLPEPPPPGPAVPPLDPLPWGDPPAAELP